MTKFAAGIGPYTAAEPHDALLTVYGEISAVPGDALSAEVEAVASTLFNRQSLIRAKRMAAQVAGPAVDVAKAARKMAQDR